jgi:aryl-alcohol dehydrogenase-like predicted oxidoreductase
MEQRLLGKTHLRASALGMGCSKLRAFWQGRSLSEGERALHEAYERGISYFDTADCYARSFSERLIGRAFRRGAPGAVVGSKVGMLKTPAAVRLAHRFQGATGGLLGVARRMAPGTRVGRPVLPPAYVKRAALRSLHRCAGCITTC